MSGPPQDTISRTTTRPSGSCSEVYEGFRESSTRYALIGGVAARLVLPEETANLGLQGYDGDVLSDLIAAASSRP